MRSPQRRFSAFTLIELMISIALVLALMIGVNYVFSSVGQATGLTQAVSRVTREMQGVQGVMDRDFATADMANSPFIVIRSYPTLAFRDRADFAGAFNPADPLIEYDTQSGALIPHSLANTDNRVHRTDVLMFFARDKFQRQTGGGTFNGAVEVQSYLADMTCQEAMIWYGHLKLPDDAWPSVNFYSPAERGISLAANPNNFFANQWMLGRVAILLHEPPSSGADAGKIITKKTLSTGTFPTEQSHIRDIGLPLGALQYNAPSFPTGYILEQSRYDLAGTSMAKMRDKLTIPPPPPSWWNGLMSALPRPSAAPPSTLYEHRFQARPFVLGGAGQRLSPADVALQAPIFLSNCSQFIVEFAGDFMAQLPTGQIDGSRPAGDGIDFNYNSTTQTRSIRWYGFPRDADGDGDIKSLTNDPNGNDVVPLRDYVSTFQFERDLNSRLPLANDYITSIPAAPLYTAAWAPTDAVRPSMFRILIAVDDPNGRFTDPLTFEYVFKVP